MTLLLFWIVACFAIAGNTAIVIALIALKFYCKTTCGFCKCDTKLTNKVAIVTGANSGIGYETAKGLALRGAKVILACRNEARACAARDKIIQETKNPNVIYKHLDLTSFKSVRSFAEDILKTEKTLDILVNNAGTGKLDNSLTEDNISIEMQINYFGPFLLTNLLLPLLKSSGPSRIVVVASFMHHLGTVDLATIAKPVRIYFGISRVYSNSKLCNILFTRELSRRLKGTEVTANCLHPGAVDTEIFKNKSKLTRYFISHLFKSAWEGAQTSIYLAVSPEVNGISGKYFVDCKEECTSSTAQNDELATKLWIVSQKIVRLKHKSK